jgi:hypothetical protein
MNSIKENNVKFLEEHPAFCVLPFIHLRMQVVNYDVWDVEDQEVGTASALCCSAPRPSTVPITSQGPNSSFVDVMQHKNFIQERKKFYNNKLPAQCKHACDLSYDKTKRDSENQRHIETILYEKVFKQPELKVIDYNFGNECNLACRMCSAGSSNQIAILASKVVSSVDKTQKLIDFGVNDLAPDKSLKFNIDNLKNGVFLKRGVPSDISAVKEALPNLNELQFAGGEPFVSKDVEDILLAAIETGDNSHIELEITTNGTKFVEEKLDIFLQFKKITFIISMDGVGSTYDYIRYPFSFSLIEKRLRGIVDYIIKNNLEKKVEINFACVGILYNLYDYQQLYTFLNSIFNKITELPVIMVMIEGIFGAHDQVHALSWDNIPNDLLNDALLSYKDIQENYLTPDKWYEQFKQYVNNRTQDAKPEGITFAKEHTLLLDELHKRTYHDHLHPKLSKYIDSIK